MIYLVGMGPGGEEYVTPQAKKIIDESTNVFGFEKHGLLLGLKEVSEGGRFTPIRGQLDNIVSLIKGVLPQGDLVLLVSGDPTVFSLSRRIIGAFPKESVTIIPGLGSYQILCAHLKLQSPLPRRFSLHGRPLENLHSALLPQEPLVLYTDRGNSPSTIASYMIDKGYGQWSMDVGFNLGTPEQRFYHHRLSEIKDKKFLDNGLNLCYVAPPQIKKGILYGIGIGPGDPELLTLKAYRILKKVDIIICPRARVKDSSLAREILEEALGVDLPYQEEEFPMFKDEKLLYNYWRQRALQYKELLDKGKSIAFVTLGDPGIYSTASYLFLALQEMDQEGEEHCWEIVPGISSFQLAAARFGLPLVQQKQELRIMALPENLSDLPLHNGPKTIVLMKIGRRLEELRVYLKEKDLQGSCSLICSAGLKGEQKWKDLSDVPKGRSGNLSLVILKLESLES